MNPSGMTPSPRLQRSLPSNILLLGGLIAFFAWFFYMRVQEVRYAKIVDEGVTALAKKDTARAKERFETYLRADPKSPQSYIDISVICEMLNEPILAMEYVQRGLEACKGAPKEQRAQLYMQLSATQALVEPTHPQTKAIASIRTALELNPTSPILQNAVGYTLVDNDQNLAEAEQLLRKALGSLQESGKDPESDTLRPALEDSFGWLLYKKGDYAGAVAALSQAVHDLPAGAAGMAAKYFYYHLGAAYRKAGQIDEARRTLAIALQYDPAFPEAKAEAALLPPLNTPAVPPVSPSVSPAPANASPPAAAPTPSSSGAPGLKL